MRGTIEAFGRLALTVVWIGLPMWSISSVAAERKPRICPKGKELLKILDDWLKADAVVLSSARLPKDAEILRQAAKQLPDSVQLVDAGPGICPPIPSLKTNPLAKKAFGAIPGLIRAKPEMIRFDKVTKAPAGGGSFHKLALNTLELTRAFCHPQSPYQASPDVFKVLLDRYAAILYRLKHEKKYLGDFGITPGVTESYLIFSRTYPNLMPKAIRDDWNRIVRMIGHAIAKNRSKDFSNPKYGSWVNADVRLVEALYYSALITGEENFRRAADKGFKKVAEALLPDGGFHYVNKQNEVFTYHAANIHALARIAQIVGKKEARELVVGSRLYYPLSIEPRGLAEYSTASSWKPYWNQTNGADGALIVADWANCPYNAYVARTFPMRPNIWLASFYRADLKTATPADNYIAYDRNIQGPRGRFGDFSFCGAGRDYGSDNRGKSSYVGCITLYPKGKLPEGVNPTWPLSAAVQDVAVEVRHTKGPMDLRRQDHYSLAVQEELTTIVRKDVAALSSIYRLSKYKGKVMPWRGEQLWIFTPNRLVGLLRLTSLKDQKAYSMAGTVKTVSGREHWGIRQEWKKPFENAHQYGDVILNVRATDFPVARTEYTDTYSGNEKKCGRLLLMDGDDQKRTMFKKGTSKYLVIEIMPSWSKPAKRVSHAVNTDGAITLTVSETGNKTYKVVLNGNAKQVTWQPRKTGTVWRKGEKYRPKWLGDSVVSAGAQADPQNPLALNAYESVLIETN